VLEYTIRSPDDSPDTGEIGGEASSTKPGMRLLCRELEVGSSVNVVEGESVGIVIALAADIGRVRVKRAKKPLRSALTAPSPGEGSLS
jgi:hypothetical protein